MSAYSRLQMDNNNRKMNELLQRIGKNSKPLFNKLTFKPSKKTEFLEIVERKLGNILTGINLDNIEKKISELDNILINYNNFQIKLLIEQMKILSLDFIIFILIIVLYFQLFQLKY